MKYPVWAMVVAMCNDSRLYVWPIVSVCLVVVGLVWVEKCRMRRFRGQA